MTTLEPEQFFDAHFRRKRRKKEEWEIVVGPKLPALVADTHAHIHMLENPGLALARAGAHGVGFVEMIVDPAEDGTRPYDELGRWLSDATSMVRVFESQIEDATYRHGSMGVPHVRIAAGIHPHNAKRYTRDLEDRLVALLADERTSALGEIGLDYHYDLSPRPVQQEVFRKQIRLAKEAHLPVVLHMREAHDDGFAILQDEGFPEAGVLLHCYNLDAQELRRWVDAGCYVAFGGPLTFKKADDVREAATIVPLDRLLTETDAPYMAPEPLRGTVCEPANVVWTADKLMDVLGATEPDTRKNLLLLTYENAYELLDRMPTKWQLSQAARLSGRAKHVIGD